MRILLASVAAVCMLATGGTLASEYRHADSPRTWQFPEDHASHPEFQTEWWYFTGIVQDERDQDLGFELTFFRVALNPAVPTNPSKWRTRDLIVAHFAMTDPAKDAFHHDERMQRAAAGLAGANTGKMRVWLDDWEAVYEGGLIELRAGNESDSIDLDLEITRAPALHGPGGWSPKDARGEGASYYYSMPRLKTHGTMRVAGEDRAVSGTTWMDHEFFSSQSTPIDGVGWDWFSARLDDGRDLMIYRVRHPDGATFPFGTVVEPDGSTRPLDVAGLELTPEEPWTSPDTQTTYPTAWTVRVPQEDLVLRSRARIPQQEIVAKTTVGFAYWEGMSSYEGSWQGQPIRGEGYVELAGYQKAPAP